jgi:hypothetical protein
MIINRTAALFILLILIPAISFCCSCVEPLPGTSEENQVLQELKDADAVFLGTVLSIWPTPMFNKRVTILVHKSWKGIDSEKVVVGTGLGGGDCGYRFNRGEQYLVYAYLDEGKLYTSICSRTTNVKHAAIDLKVLGTSMYSPKMSSLSSTQLKFPWLFPLTMFFAVSLFMFFMYRIFRSARQK